MFADAFNPEEVPAAPVLCPDLSVGWADIAHGTAAVTGTMNVTSATHSPHPGRFCHPTEARMVLWQVLIFSVN